MVEPYLLFAHAPADLSELSLERGPEHLGDEQFWLVNAIQIATPPSLCVVQMRSYPSIESMLLSEKGSDPKNKHETTHRGTSSSTSARCEEMEEKASQ